jgi:hypothetical protein
MPIVDEAVAAQVPVPAGRIPAAIAIPPPAQANRCLSRDMQSELMPDVLPELLAVRVVELQGEAREGLRHGRAFPGVRLAGDSYGYVVARAD